MTFLEQQKVIWSVNHSHTPHIYGVSVEPPERTEQRGGVSSSITTDLQHILLVSSSLLLKCQTPTQASRSHCNPLLTHSPMLAKLLCKAAPKWSSYTQYLQLTLCLKVEKGSWTLGDRDCLGILLNELLSNISSLYFGVWRAVFKVCLCGFFHRSIFLFEYWLRSIVFPQTWPMAARATGPLPGPRRSSSTVRQSSWNIALPAKSSDRHVPPTAASVTTVWVR